MSDRKVFLSISYHTKSNVCVWYVNLIICSNVIIVICPEHIWNRSISLRLLLISRIFCTMLYTWCCTLFIVHFLLYTLDVVHCLLYTLDVVNCLLYTWWCTLFIVHLMVYIWGCTLICVHFLLYTFLYTWCCTLSVFWHVEMSKCLRGLDINIR